MKLEIGKYIRTKDGYLRTILGISEQTGRPYHTDKTNLGNYIELDNISKCVDEMTDLIEVDDYINGHRVVEICKNNRKKEPSTMIYCEYGNTLKGYYENDIKTILTKELFEVAACRVEVCDET